MPAIRLKDAPEMSGCEVLGCGQTVFNGAAIYRTSPKGGPFRGMCQDHFAVLRPVE